MKQKLFKTMLLLCALIVGSGTAWADEEVYYTLDGTITGGTNGYATESEITQDKITWMVTANTTINPWRIGGKSLDGVDREVYSKTSMGAAITKVELTVGTANDVTVNSLKLVVARDAEFKAVIDEVSADFEASSTITFVPQSPLTQWAQDAFYKFVFNVSVTATSNMFVQFTGATFYRDGGAIQEKVSAPVIGGDAEFLNSTSVEITCATEGATILYSISHDGGTVWSANTEYGNPINLTESGIVKAKAIKTGMDDSNEVTKTFTKLEPIPNIQGITSTATTTPVSNYVLLTDALVTYKNGTTAYLQDAYGGAVMLYQCAGDLAVGDKINGYMYATYKLYYGLPEVTAFQLIDGYEKTTGNEVTPTEITIADLITDTPDDPYALRLSRYVKIVDATVTSVFSSKNCTIEQGGYSIVLRDQNSSATLTSTKDDIVTVTGHVAIYNSTKQIAVYEPSQITVKPAPTIPTIAETRAKDLNTEVETQGIVTSCDVGPVYATAYIQDETAAICVYASKDLAADLAVGNKINVTGTLKNYRNLLRIESPTITIVSTGNIVTPEVITISEIIADYESTNAKQGKLVKIENAVVTSVLSAINIEIQQGGKSIMVAGLSENNLAVDDIVTLVGNISVESTLRIANPTNVVKVVPVADYATLPFEWEGGASADFEALNGVTTDGLGSDYAEGNKPYLIKLDGTGDYIQIKTDSQPGTLTIGVKMIGGANTSTITVQESSDGTVFTDVEELTISGKQNDVLELETKNAFASTSRYVRLYFTKGSNVGVGPITITKAAAPSTDPSIAVSTTSINVLAAGGSGTIEVTYNNITTVVAEVFFCDAGGNSATYDWITANINGENNVEYHVDANTAPEARRAYFKVWAYDDDMNEVYSGLITIIQNRYVADFATLPFEWDDTTTPTGITNSGVGTYTSSPYLKFDGTGDYIILKINERPGTLTYDIKGNSFSGGTFTVQTSEDGVSYSDLETYTVLGDKQSESFDNLDEDVRYIKWIYTEKVNGNVALGNINLTKYGAQSLAAITVDPATVGATAAETEGTLDITYANLPISDMNDFDIQYYDAEGNEIAEPAEPAWIDVLVAEQDPKIGEGYVVSYYMIENDGAARTAYFKVYAMDAETNLVYSNLVTVTQAAYVAPATLGNWVAASLADINANDVFVIVGNNGDDYAMTNDNGTSSAPSVVAVTVVSNTLSGVIDDNIKWNLSGNATDGYTFYPNGETETWLYCTNTNNGVRVGTGDAKHFTLSGNYLTTTETTDQRYLGIYNSQDWRCYINTTGNIAGQTFTFYKQLAVKLNGSGYATFSSTVPIDFSDDSEFTAWAITEISGTTISFSQITGAVPANTGVLLKGTANTTVYPVTAISGTAPTSNLLTAISTATTVTAGQYYGLSGDKFVKVGAGTVPAGKALLPASAVGSSIKAFNFVFEDDPDGINSIDNGELTIDNAAIYNLAGQRLSKMQKGINIVNGKKILY